MKRNETELEILYGGEKEEAYGTWFKCKKCGGEQIMGGFKFCPHCGRKIIA